MHSNINAEAANELYTDDLRVKLLPITRQVNINAARRTDGDAPAAKLNNHNPVRIISGFT